MLYGIQLHQNSSSGTINWIEHWNFNFLSFEMIFRFLHVDVRV